MYRKVMRERSLQSFRSTGQGPSGQKLRFRSSHHRIAPLKISHSRPGAWEPPIKDADRDDIVPIAHGRKAKKR
jgi:hypothetical protein